MHFNTEQKADLYIKDNYQRLFIKYPKLNLLATLKTGDSSFKILTNIKLDEAQFNDLFTHIYSYSLAIDDPRESFSEIVQTNVFNPAFGVKNAGNNIYNEWKGQNEYGSLGLNFFDQLGGEYYLMSNEHVLSTGYDSIGDGIYLSDINQKPELIAHYSWGKIDGVIDVAYASYIDDFWSQDFEQNSITAISERVEIPESILINGDKSEVISRNAYIRMGDSPYYEDHNIYKNQILTTNILQRGDSGIVATNETRDKIVGLFFAVSDTFSALNPIHEVFETILSHGQISTSMQDIIILNEFK